MMVVITTIARSACGWLAVALLTNGARSEAQNIRVTLAALATRAHLALIGPGALLTVGSGVLWSMAVVGSAGVESRVAPIGTLIMTAAGIVGGILVAVVAIPTALKVKATALTTEDGLVLPVFERQERRLKIVSTLAGFLALVSLAAAVVAP